MHRLVGAEQIWLGIAADLGGLLLRSHDPVTFIIGAGCSVTSGCPSTATIEIAFEAATAGRFLRNTRDVLHEVLPKEHEEILAPLFQDASPYVGYLSLAVLARSRPVVVLNLNWDPLVEAACERMGVPFRALDLSHRPVDFSLAQATSAPGVTCVHLHGTTSSNPRFSRLSTLKFDSDEREVLQQALAFTTVIVGTTLVADTDMTQLLLETAKSRSEGGTIWQFSRLNHSTGGIAGFTTHPSPLHGAPGFYYAEGADVDFDRLMVVLLGSTQRRSFDTAYADQPSLVLPRFSQLIWPNRKLLAQCVPPRPVIIMTGEPQLGKSTAAHLLAYLYSLWREPTSTEVRRFEQPHATMAALSSVSSTPGIYLLEDPFGSTRDFEPNPGFIEQLTAFVTAPSGSNVIVTSRLTNWNHATANHPTNLRPLPSAVAAWYDKASLRMAVSVVASERTDILDRIDQGDLDTPARLTSALRGEPFSAGPGSQTDVVLDKLGLLHQHPQLAFLCSLVRLQEFAGTYHSRTELEAIAKLPSGLAAEVDVFLNIYQFEDEERLALRHATDQEAVDAYLEHNSNEVDVSLAAESSLHAREFQEALRLARVLHSLKQGRVEVIAELDTSKVQRWCAALFAAFPSEKTLDAIRVEQLDPWATVDLAYEVVRLWPVLQAAGAGHGVLERFTLHRRGNGTYALVEACLYLGQSVGQQVHSAIQTALWRLLDAPDAEAKREAVLIVDAFAWRPIPPAYRDWLNNFVRRNRADPLWRGFLRFCEAYHRSGLAHLVGNTDIDTGPLTAEEADAVAWLVRWHFVHQAHSRTLLLRSRMVDKDFLCRSLHSQSADDSPRALSRLIEHLSVEEVHRGWALLLCCNAMSLGLGVTEETIGKVDQMISGLPVRDVGATVAALTYERALTFPSLRKYLARGENREFALDVLKSGAVVDGIAVHPPRFSFVRHPAMLERDFKLKWPKLWQHQVMTNDVKALAANLQRAAEQLIASKVVPVNVAYEIVHAVSRGDLREIEDAVVAREATDDVYEHLVRIAVELRLQSQPKLF